MGVGLGAGAAAYNLLGQAAGGAADFIGDSIKASSDLAESMSKAQVIFGPAAKDIEDFGATAAHSLGLSKQAALEASATFGNFFTGIGQSQEQAADMSKKLVTLAGDLASFNNIDPGLALEKLRAGLTGEAEPLRAVGVFLTEAKVKAKAMELGLADAHGQLSEGAKVLARYQIILDETGTAQGDFARTSEGLANKQRIANADLINAQAELGESFKPIALQVTQWQIDFIQGLGVAGQKWGEFTDGLSDFGDFITPWDTYVSVVDERMLKVVQNSQDADRKITATFHELPGKIADDFRQSAPVIETSTAYMMAPLDQNMADAAHRANIVAKKLPHELADDIRAGRTDWQGAWEEYKDDLDNKLTRAAEIAKLKGILSGKKLAEGLRSQDPALRAEAAAMEKTITARLKVLEGTLSDIGERAGKDLAAAIKREGPKTKAAAQLHRIAVKNALGTLPSSAYGWGKNTGREFADGLRSQAANVDHASEHLAAEVRNNLRVASPAKKGPMSEGGGPEGWGARFGTLYARGLASTMPGISGAASGYAGKVATAATPAQSSSIVQNFNLTVLGDVRARDGAEILMSMKRLKGIGTKYPIPGVIRS